MRRADALRWAPLLAALVLALTLAACGGEEAGEEGETEVLSETDAGPVGLAALRGGDKASGSQNQRVPITREGTPTAIYAVKLNELEDGVRVGALATVTLTKCAITDYMPNARAYTACEGTKVYDYDPVQVESGFRLVGGGSKPDLGGPSTDIGDPLQTRCTTAIHHCTLSQDAVKEVAGDEITASGQGWLVYEVTARSPKAVECKSNPTKCNVLAVETQKGTAMYGVRVKGEPEQRRTLPVATKPRTEKLGVLIDRGNKNEARDIVYSIELTSADGLAEIRGDQLVVGAKLEIEEKLPQAPDIANYLVLSDKPNSIRGRYLLSDSYVKTGNNGENCDKSCAFVRNAAVTSILGCDVKAGRRYVNFVADASRAEAKAGETVDVTGGYLKVSEYFDSKITDDKQSVGNCNR